MDRNHYIQTRSWVTELCISQALIEPLKGSRFRQHVAGHFLFNLISNQRKFHIHKGWCNSCDSWLLALADVQLVIQLQYRIGLRKAINSTDSMSGSHTTVTDSVSHWVSDCTVSQCHCQSLSVSDWVSDSDCESHWVTDTHVVNDSHSKSLDWLLSDSVWE